MYRPPPFGPFFTRADALQEYSKQLALLETFMSNDGMYLCGDVVSYADACIFPSCVFAEHMLPKFNLQVPSKLQSWFDTLRRNDPAFTKVYDEMKEALASWDDRRRWDTILGAGWIDAEPATIFDKILAGDISVEVVQETEKLLAFKDINPAGPAHVLIIPKVRGGLTRLTKATAEHVEILGTLLVAASEIARNKDLGFGDGARVVFNDGPDGGQEVMHLHVHVIGGRQMQWPPG
jgi:diadenosine tetraphosphate (Ap4A) HIT family hydrolase